MSPKKLIGKVEFRENLAGQNHLIRIRFDEKVDFTPGQYVSLKVNGEGLRRSYSVASLPGGNIVDVLVDVSPMGEGSKYILSLKVGDEVEVLGFLGNFTIDLQAIERARNITFLATGTGIAPMRPMIEELLDKKSFKGEVRLVWGVRHETDLYWLKEMDNISRDYDNFKFDIVISQPLEDWPGFRGHLGGLVNGLTQDWSKTLVYLCGSREMIVETEKRLKEKGVPEEQIHYEKYY
jgi:NAD(P)H-flavin reductase